MMAKPDEVIEIRWDLYLCCLRSRSGPVTATADDCCRAGGGFQSDYNHDHKTNSFETITMLSQEQLLML